MTNDMTMSQRIETAIRRALRIAGTTPAPLRMGSTPGWDSMGHMMVVLEIEKEFQAKFPPYVLPALVDVESIERTLSKPVAKAA